MNIFTLWFAAKAIKSIRNSPYSYHPELYSRRTAQEIEESERLTTWQDWLIAVSLTLFLLGGGFVIGTVIFLLLTYR